MNICFLSRMSHVSKSTKQDTVKSAAWHRFTETVGESRRLFLCLPTSKLLALELASRSLISKHNDECEVACLFAFHVGIML